MLLLGRRDRADAARRVGLAVALATFAVASVVLARFDPSVISHQFPEQYDWLPELGVSFHLGVDGISLPCVLLVTVMAPLALLGAWTLPDGPAPARTVAVLVFEAGAIGVFTSLDLLLFYASWELMLIPIHVLWIIDGGRRRARASRGYLIQALAGSALMLVAITSLAVRHFGRTGIWSYAIEDLVTLGFPPVGQTWLLAAVAVACLGRLSVFPFHTWLSGVYAHVPSVVPMLAGGVVLVSGGYGLIRIGIPLFPDAAAASAPWLAGLGVATLVYALVAAMLQVDMRRVLAYLVVSQMGVVALAMSSLTVQGISGAMVHLIGVAVWATGLLVLLGAFSERRGTTVVREFVGLAGVMPRWTVAWMTLCLGAVACPGTAGFVGLLLTMTGIADSGTLAEGWPLGAIVAAGVALWPICLVPVLRRIAGSGSIVHRNRGLRDLDTRESLIAAVLIALMFAIGVFPNRLVRTIEPVAARVLAASSVPVWRHAD